jgi:glutamate-1-semialdehyde 2,1-aminomutase/spore coat polysaccharide biosynthesis protein SpsF
MGFTKCKGLNARSIVTFDQSEGNPLEIKTLMQQEMIKRGIIWSGFHNLSYSHTDEDIDYTLQVYEDILQIVADAVEDNNVKSLLRGEILEPVFRKTGNFNSKPKSGVAA